MSNAPAGSLLETNFKNNRRVFGALGNRLTHYEPGKELLPVITSVATPGHTPGHVSHVIASGSDKVFVQADVTLLPALFVRNPGWRPMFDFDAEMAEQTRRASTTRSQVSPTSRKAGRVIKRFRCRGMRRSDDASSVPSKLFRMGLPIPPVL